MAVTRALPTIISLALCLAFFTTFASTTPLPSPERQIQEPAGVGLTWEIFGEDPKEIICTTDRSSDYYGLGVRLGVYFMWVTGWVANISLPDEIAGAMDTNSIFMFALVIAMGRCTITGLISRLDGLILMHLSGGTLFSVMSIWGYRTCFYSLQGPKGISNFGGFGTHMRLLLCTTVSTYGLWFWYFGVHGSLNKGIGACATTYTFFFGKLDVEGGIRIYYIIVCIGCTFYFGMMTLVGLLGPIMRLMKMRWLLKYKFFHYSSRLKYATGFNYGQLRIIFWVLSIGNAFWMIFSMVMVEMTLNFNHVKNVLGENGRIFFPSQLIPFTIGVAGLLRVMYLSYDDWRNPGNHQASLDRAPTIHHRSSTFPQGKDIFKVFSPANTQTSMGERKGTTDDSMQFESSDLDPEVEGTPIWWRFLISWLPWLQALQWFRTRTEPEPHQLRTSRQRSKKLNTARALPKRTELSDPEPKSDLEQGTGVLEATASSPPKEGMDAVDATESSPSSSKGTA